MKIIPLLLVTALVLLLTGCNRSQSGAGLQLPAGDANRGRTAFVELQCFQCHAVEGVALPAPTVEEKSIVVLGGEVARLRSYGDLVTSIIHPGKTQSEKVRFLDESGRPRHPMQEINEQMTVAQLIDLVAFLHPHYRELPPLYDPSLMR